MLKLENVSKIYHTGDIVTEALKDVTIAFRKNEFVSILGPSGCGKTTMLNIIGGLDQYTSGNLIINHKSTKEYKDKDWDTYRNHSIGFVFQNYNLIPHQTVLQNVELALTLSGVSKKERRQRAIDALDKVGLKDKIKSKPNQLSGGQMQRVAIARAIVNNPDIILADEPTGALDSESSLQVMEILKEISKDKLIIMVTHNADLAQQYSTRIVKLLDGKLIDDSNPYKYRKNAKGESKAKQQQKDVTQKLKKKRMSFFTALALSLKNLLTKKARTILTAFAGSIGIIGIALILAISTGFNTYVNKIQEDTLSSYPVEISTSNYDLASLMQIFMQENVGKPHEDNNIHTKDELTEMLSKFNASSSKNDLKSFKLHLAGDGKDEITQYTTAIQYVYDINVNAYYYSNQNGLICANPTTVFSDVINSYPQTNLDTPDKQLRYALLTYMFGSSSSFYSNEFWSETLDNQELLKSQYELVGENSRWATEYNEVMIVVDKNSEISDYTLYGLGLLDQSDLYNLLDKYIQAQDNQPTNKSFTIEDLLSIEYKIILESDYYKEQADGSYVDIRKISDASERDAQIAELYNSNKAIPIKVAGVIREKEESSAHSIKNTIAYNSALTKRIIALNASNSLIQSQLQNNTTNVLTGKTFAEENTTKEIVLKMLGYADLSLPQEIYLYPTNFDAKEKISNFIKNYNSVQIQNNEDSKVITYSDTIGTMMSSVSTIISSISYVLIAFVSVSLIVSSIMIGIITYISVIERTKEIGVLRSVGASKKDVKRVFTAESFIIGLSSGIIGITITLLLTIPINILLKSLTGIGGIATLPIVGAIVLIAISVTLTFIAGLIPARIAAKKDPVLALRSE